MPKITKRTVDAMRPEIGRDVFTWDTELRGFGVRMKPSGAAAFLIQYRTLQGRTRRHVIGRVGTLTPDQARTEAKARLAEVATKGAESRYDIKIEPFFRSLLKEYYKERGFKENGIFLIMLC
jgi:Arm domain-containing DNA-binding protein